MPHHFAVIDIYESAIQSKGQFGVVFKRDDESAYFYLLDMHKPAGNAIIAALDVGPAISVRSDAPVRVRWSEVSSVAGLFVGDVLTAIFETHSDEPKGRFVMHEDFRLF
ncbi:DUF2251 domain-containing protein [uncultured Sphingomonas sp.]|uniref:DUF2251 domain-containing protein n=1 Tax=uncultured Sphingomonas sp. TaxID=158754 RepID=UPI002600340A|nr:DUF2251 domain-containing protein [uncultured Sphingomonas sp.]